jgi:ferric-dicitrate binding protein FerR (iron transport regulator)
MTREYEQAATDRAWKNLYEKLSREENFPAPAVHTPPSRAAHTWRRAASSAAILLIAAALGWRTMRHDAGTTPEMRVLSNEESGSTLVSTLEDGSVVYLSAETSIRYPNRFRDDKREISLRGDAFFDVDGNRSRPFLVDTETATIEVRGTAFGIRDGGKSTFVLAVRQGEVKATLKKNNRSLYVKAGHAVRLHADNLQPTDGDDAKTPDDHPRRIRFKDERLADVVRILNKYARSAQIEIAPELADMRLTVALDDDDADTIARLVCLALDLQYAQSGQTIYIRPYTNR